MAKTQVLGDQIKDADITSADIANNSITPSKISAGLTDDFTFPRDVTIDRNLIVSGTLNGNTIVMGHSIKDDGSLQTQRASINFTGDGVVISDDVGNNATNISISLTNVVLSDDQIVSSDDEIITVE